MCSWIKIYSSFHRNESGAVGVDYIVVTAVIATFGLATVTGIQGGLSSQSSSITTALTSYESVANSGGADDTLFVSIDGVEDASDSAEQVGELSLEEQLAAALTDLEDKNSELSSKSQESASAAAEVRAAKKEVAAAKKAVKKASSSEKAAARALLVEAKSNYTLAINTRKQAATALKSAKAEKSKASKAYKSLKKLVKASQ